MSYTAETKQLITEYTNNGYNVVDCASSIPVLSRRIFGQKTVKLSQLRDRTIWAIKPPKSYCV